jgi:hypothetical protein
LNFDSDVLNTELAAARQRMGNAQQKNTQQQQQPIILSDTNSGHEHS